jgi:hypothetical protein
MTDTTETVAGGAARAEACAAVLMDHILIGPARLQVLRAVAELNIADHLADGGGGGRDRGQPPAGHVPADARGGLAGADCITSNLNSAKLVTSILEWEGERGDRSGSERPAAGIRRPGAP